MQGCSVYREIAQSQRFSEVDRGDVPGNQNISENAVKGGEVYE